MKHLITILASLTFVFNAVGQDKGIVAEGHPKGKKPISQAKGHPIKSKPINQVGQNDTIIFSGSTPSSRGFIIGDQSKQYDPYKGSIDTVLTLLLICDTAFHYGKTYIDTLRIYKEYEYSARWMVGYSVIETHGSPFWASVNGYSREVRYLDDKKQPLSKNIIVWQSINQK